MKQNRVTYCLLAAALMFAIFVSPAQAQVSASGGDIYVIGVVQPLNKTELPGHIDFPYFCEGMQNFLSSSSNNYVVKVLDEDDLEAAGYTFSSIKPDSDLQPDQISKLCDVNRLDALMTGKIKNIDRELEPRFLEEAGRFLIFDMDGVVYDRSGQQIWCYSTSGRQELVRKGGKFIPPFQTQAVNFYLSKTQEIGSAFTDRFGSKPIDRDPPTIDFENIKSGDRIKASCIVLKGTVSDNAEVDSITVNDQVFPLRQPSKQVEMFYPVQIPQGVKGQRVLVNIQAKDVYGNLYVKELNLTWDTPVNGIVTSVNPDTISITFSPGDFARISNGMGFWLFSVDQFRNPLSNTVKSYTLGQIGPVIIVRKFPNKNVALAKFMKGSESLLNVVKKGDIVK